MGVSLAGAGRSVMRKRARAVVAGMLTLLVLATVLGHPSVADPDEAMYISLWGPASPGPDPALEDPVAAAAADAADANDDFGPS